MRILKQMLRKMLVLPVFGVSGDGSVDMEELGRIVRERTARAEKSVLRDYFAQLGLNEEQAKEAENAYKEAKASNTPTMQQLTEAREKAKAAHEKALKAQAGAEAKVQMALLGVREECFSDVMKLADEELSLASSGESVDTNAVRAAIENVISRLPSLTGNTADISTGTAGRFPRGNSAVDSYRQQLNRAREIRDNAAAAAIISQAAEKGITLR